MNSRTTGIMVKRRRRKRIATTTTTATLLLLSTTLLLLLIISTNPCHAALPCSTDDECATKLQRSESYCLDGYCSNPFVEGCLKTLRRGGGDDDGDDDVHTTTALRTCNSDDLRQQKNTQQPQQHCINTDETFGYPEIRIHNADWESSIFFAWIMQIILMEILHVPATVGLTTSSTSVSSFYSPHNTIEYSTQAYAWDALHDAGKCESTQEKCTHVLPEVWSGQMKEWTKALHNGSIERVSGNGQVGKMSWFIPAFTALEDETLISFYGLRGQTNRKKLAAAFNKPTTWREYCEEISTTNCTSPDTTATHYPTTPKEGNKYYDSLAYTGHFRATEENDCSNIIANDTTHQESTSPPSSCVGHFIAPPCRWSSTVDSQIYWNDIYLKATGPLEPNGGYEYSSMLEIWRAANATKSNVIMWWWSPETLNEEFYATQAELQQVLLPRTTYECLEHRPDAAARCSTDYMERVGETHLGSCDQEANSIKKVVSKKFVDESNLQSDALRSPAAIFVKEIEISDLEMNELLGDWFNKGIDPYGNDAREAVCSFVNDNLEHLMEFIPPGYPRTMSNQSPYQTPFMTTATVLACLSALAVIIMSAIIYRYRNARVFIYAQTHIILLIMIGFFLITIAAILTSLEPTDVICIAQSWFITLGYTVELVPLLVKVAAINKILASAQKMRRVSISQQKMRRNVLIVVAFTIVVVIIWSVLDPPQKVTEVVISDKSDQIVERSIYCASEHEVWVIGSLTWQSILLVAAAVLAYQSRGIVFEFNESRSLGMMIYSHVVFLVLRAVIYYLGQSDVFQPNLVAGATSTLLSLDTLAAMCIYIVPKCLNISKDPSVQEFMGASSNHAAESYGGGASDHTGGGTLKRMRSSHVVNEIEARAFAAQMAYNGAGGSVTGTLNLEDSFSISNISNIDSIRGPMVDSLRLRPNRISEIKEASDEIDIEGGAHGYDDHRNASLNKEADEPGLSEPETSNLASPMERSLTSTTSNLQEEDERELVTHQMASKGSLLASAAENGQSLSDRTNISADVNFIENNWGSAVNVTTNSGPTPRKRTRFENQSTEQPQEPRRSSLVLFPKRRSKDATTRRRRSTMDLLAGTTSPTKKKHPERPKQRKRSSMIMMPRRASTAAPPGHEVYVTQEIAPDGSFVFTPRIRPAPGRRNRSMDHRPQFDEIYVDSSDSDSINKNDDHDAGGPRFTSVVHNQRLDNAVRRSSLPPEFGSIRNNLINQSQYNNTSRRNSSYMQSPDAPIVGILKNNGLQAASDKVSSTAMNNGISSQSTLLENNHEDAIGQSSLGRRIDIEEKKEDEEVSPDSTKVLKDLEATE